MSEPRRGEAYEFFVSLSDIFDPQFFVINPTIAVNDFQVSKDGGSFSNLATLPVVAPALSSSVQINLNISEMTADKIVVKGKDLAGDQWGDIMAFIDAPAGNSETTLDLLEGDKRESSTNQKIFLKGTTTLLLEKNITGSLLQSDVTINTIEP